MPGPGMYEEGPKMGQHAKKISIQGRTKNYSKFWRWFIFLFYSAFNKLTIEPRSGGIWSKNRDEQQGVVRFEHHE